jgi:hypothetical protein
LKTTRTGGRRTGQAERGRGVHHLRGVGRGEPAVERCRQGVTGRYRRGHPARLANGAVSAARPPRWSRSQATGSAARAAIALGARP